MYNKAKKILFILLVFTFTILLNAYTELRDYIVIIKPILRKNTA